MLSYESAHKGNGPNNLRGRERVSRGGVIELTFIRRVEVPNQRKDGGEEKNSGQMNRRAP